jgi:superfamily II DNA or RNA helicase
MKKSAPPSASSSSDLDPQSFRLKVILETAPGVVRFEWQRIGENTLAARAQLGPMPAEFALQDSMMLDLDLGGAVEADSCRGREVSVRALVGRLRKRLPVPDGQLEVWVAPFGSPRVPTSSGAYHIPLPAGEWAWKWLASELLKFTRIVEAPEIDSQLAGTRGQRAARALAHDWLRLLPRYLTADLFPPEERLHRLSVCFNKAQGHIQFDWTPVSSQDKVASVRVRCTGCDQLTWWLDSPAGAKTEVTSGHMTSIRSHLKSLGAKWPVAPDQLSAFWVELKRGGGTQVIDEPPIQADSKGWDRIAEIIWNMARSMGASFLAESESARAPGELFDEMDSFYQDQLVRDEQRLLRREQKRIEDEARRQETLARMAEERRRRQAARERKTAAAKAPTKSLAAPANPAERPPLPPVAILTELPLLSFQETAFTLPDLKAFALRERAALWWISNQSDNLLCLPYCRIEHLEYQQRTALRVLGPLRGRALLSDEVGLGKTIEAGLVLKELLTRGMVKRFLVLTVPSLVDQWEEELNDKFGLPTATTNQAAARNPDLFWRENTGIVASLHTLKQPAQIEIARQVHWDLLIVDEAHYLRNRESQAWQAVNELPRHFLLLLTATPVQNSLEELYNLVTLLQPGQLPTPKEFRARFINPKRPREPREPEELRRLLGQVMIRNTRANAGLNLPPRRAETVLFQPDPEEHAFWERWEAEFREKLAGISASQASLWGRLLLQAAGSSPPAWRSALRTFPDPQAATAWSEQAPLEASWRRKCDLLPPLTQVEGGLVVFTQFLETQAALAAHLQGEGVRTFLINGSTPAPRRQPITEEFHQHGGALLLTHSGTEGRNLQFCHRLANFDLPWNPMEIEQRIGRLHRLGQKHPVRIYNFVQAGTLQEHLLQVLQEKLNLFELVVGETGLVLGERFGSDEFAEEVLRRWRDSEGKVAEAIAGLGAELAAARDGYNEVKKLDETLFEKDYESL